MISHCIKKPAPLQSLPTAPPVPTLFSDGFYGILYGGKPNILRKNGVAYLVNIKTIERRNTLLFLLLCFFTYLLWVFILPYNSAPDEYMRIDLVTFMVNNNALPTGGDESIRNPIWGFSYAYLPFLSQMVSALFCKIHLLLGFNPAQLYLAARLPGVLFSTASAWFLLQIGNRLFKTGFKWLFAAGVAFLPQYIFLSAYTNNETLAFLAVTIIAYCWLFGAEKGWPLKYCVGLGAGISLCALSYYNAYGFILFSIPYFFITLLLYHRRQGTDKKTVAQETLRKAGIIVVIFLVLAGWWFVRSYLLYGDVTGLGAMTEASEQYAAPAQKPSNRIHPESLPFMLFDMGWILTTLKSLIGLFGYMSIVMAGSLYRLYVIAAGIGIACNAFLLARLRRKREKPAPDGTEEALSSSNRWLFVLALVLAAGTSVVLSIYNAYTSDYQAQGRYIIYVIIPVCFFVAKGFENAVLFFKKPTLTKVLPPVLCTAYVLLSYFIFMKYIVATYLYV